ncbi:MAG TPA: ABC transporter permease [Thermoanaerobaculia bacterium]|nr:ABC transporter permease [Thermoanaerobaculia bacterium]
MEAFIQDLRFATRLIVKHPGFTAIAVLCLALGIGANCAIFSLIDAVLLRPLPYNDPDRIVMVWNQQLQRDLPRLWVSEPEFFDYQARNEVFSDTAGYFYPVSQVLSGQDEPERLKVAIVSGRFFPLLGVAPVVGRTFGPEEDVPGNEAVVVLSHGFWQRRFAGDPGVVGKRLTLSGNDFTVLGVMPADFRFFPPEVELFVPLALDRANLDVRTARYLFFLGRLKPGLDPAMAQEAMSIFARRLQQQYPDAYPENSGWGINLVPLQEDIAGNLRPVLFLLMGAVSFVLLIACVNVANLLIARTAAREREVAVRIAIGASGSRLLRQFLTETLLIALLAGALGLTLALWGTRLLLVVSPASLPHTTEIRLNADVLAFTSGIALFTALLCGLLPALQAARKNVQISLKEGGRSGGGSQRRRRTHNALVVAEVALSLVLLIGAGLTVRSFLKLQKVDPGFDPAGVLTMRLALPSSKYGEDAKQRSFYAEFLERLESSGQLQAVGVVSNLPLSDSEFMGGIQPEGFIPPPGEGNPIADWRVVSPGYFDTMRIRLRQGRLFSSVDHEDAPGTVVIDKSLADRYWPDQDPLGRRLRLSGLGPDSPWMTVVGVVDHVKHYGLDVDSRVQLYLPYRQTPYRSMFVVVRSQLETAAAINLVKRELRAIDPGLPISEVLTMEQRLSTSLASRRFSMLLFSMFASVALVLAVVGIYGVLAHLVTERTHEIGLRIVLGAHKRDILRLIVGQALRVGGLGIVLGIVAALMLTRFMTSMLFLVDANDLATFGMVALLLTLTVVIASYLPALRASRIQPGIALRSD